MCVRAAAHTNPHTNTQSPSLPVPRMWLLAPPPSVASFVAITRLACHFRAPLIFMFCQRLSWLLTRLYHRLRLEQAQQLGNMATLSWRAQTTHKLLAVTGLPAALPRLVLVDFRSCTFPSCGHSIYLYWSKSPTANICFPPGFLYFHMFLPCPDFIAL